MPALLHTFGPTEFENICLAAPTMETGIAFLRDKTGLTATPILGRGGAWNTSAVLHTTSGGVIEVLAPNPDFTGLNHTASEFAKLSVPQLTFWSMMVRDFDTAYDLAGQLDHPAEEVQALHIDEGGFRQSVKAARLGPGENMIRPVLSAHDFAPVYPTTPNPACTATALHLSHWEAPPLNRLLDGLGSRLRASPGAPALRLDLETPNGPVTLESGAWVQGGWGQTLGRLGRSARNLFRRG